MYRPKVCLICCRSVNEFCFVRAVYDLHLIQNVVFVALIFQLLSSYFFKIIFFDLIFYFCIFIHYFVAQFVFCLASVAKLRFDSVFENQLLLLGFFSQGVFVQEKIQTNISKFLLDQFSIFFNVFLHRLSLIYLLRLSSMSSLFLSDTLSC